MIYLLFMVHNPGGGEKAGGKAESGNRKLETGNLKSG